MKIEIERKILNIDPEKLAEKLKSIGAEKTFEGLIKTKYFDYPDKRFEKSDELLRARLLKNHRVEVVFKCNPKKENGCKIYDEKEIHLSTNEWDNITDLLTALGFVETMYFEKKRVEFALPESRTKFEIDEYPLLNPFLEIEAESPEEIEKWITKLEFESHEQTDETINELFKRMHPVKNLNGLTFQWKTFF